MDTFMTRKLNDAQNINLEEKLNKIWSTLDRDYFVKDEVTDKLDNLTKSVKDTYCTLENFNESEDDFNQRFRDNAKRMLGHEEQLVTHTTDLQGLNSKVSLKAS